MRPNKVPKNRQHRFKAACDTCGDVELGAGELAVQLSAVNRGGTYSFACPRCGRASVHPAAPRVVELLVSAGVTARAPFRDPIAQDEVAAFVARLDADDTWLAEILG